MQCLVYVNRSTAAFTVIWQKIELFWHERDRSVYIRALNFEIEAETFTDNVGTASSFNFPQKSLFRNHVHIRAKTVENNTPLTTPLNLNVL